jgi:hypothetical protein
MVYQMYMNGAHNGDAFIQSEFWMSRTLADLDARAALHGTDPETLGAVLIKARETEQRSGAHNAAQDIWQFLLGLAKQGDGGGVA